MLLALLRPSLVRRFIEALRNEGLGPALTKARIYMGMVLRGGGRSAVPSVEAPAETGEGYLHGVWRDLARSDGFHVTEAPAVQRRRRRIALIGDLNLPQCRKYRVEQLVHFWGAQGVELTYAHYQDLPRCVNALQGATHLMEYRLQNMAVVSMYRYEARRLRLPILYDIDDPLFSVSAYETYGNMEAVEPGLKQHFVREAPKYLEAMNGADILTFSTPELCNHAALYSARPAFLRRNFADAETLETGRDAVQARREDGLFRIAFASGSRGHEADFVTILPTVVEFLRADKRRRLMILGHFGAALLPEDLRDRIEQHRFTSYDTYLHRLARADCALLPLGDDTFSRCKSAVRVLDAAAVQVPSIAGEVGDMRNVIRDGKTGLIARTPDEWHAALDRLAGSAAMRREMGRAARCDLERRWAGDAGPQIVSPEVIRWVCA